VFDLAVFSDDIDQDLKHALDVIESLGVKWVEIRSAWGRNLVDHSDDQAREVRDAIHARGLRVRCIAAPLFKCHLREAGAASQEQFFAAPHDLAAQMAVLRKAVHLARMFNTHLVRCFSFWRIEGTSRAIWEEMGEQFREPVRLAEREGIVLVMENDFECNLATGREAAGFIEEIDSPSLRLLWDPGNAYFAGETPYPTGYRRARHLVTHVHLKDAVRDATTGVARWVALGSGEVDLLGQLRALKADGFSGVLAMENHYTPPGGNKEDGVRESFRGLQRLMAQAS
jgi:sugar phosphate isomerase/epimerase